MTSAPGFPQVMVHPQHKAHTLTEKEYVYVPQVENSDWGTRQVID